jgi:hypothetical protein
MWGGFFSGALKRSFPLLKQEAPSVFPRHTRLRIAQGAQAGVPVLLGAAVDCGGIRDREIEEGEQDDCDSRLLSGYDCGDVRMNVLDDYAYNFFYA